MKKYWLTVISDFIKKYELKLFMNLTGLKIIHYDLLARGNCRKHNNKISRVYFSCSKYTKG